jgi:hypothetical protein
MIATKTTTLMVAMAVLGIVPVVAHAQTVDIDELVDQSGTPDQSNTATQTSSPNQEETAANVEGDDTTTPTNVVFATVGPGGTLTAPLTSTVTDNDVFANSQTETQTAPATQTATNTPTQTQTQSSSQIPTLTVGDLLGLLPAGG